MSKAITKQRSFVAACEHGLRFYLDEQKAGNASRYGDLAALIRTAQDVVHVQTGKLRQMEQEADAAEDIPMRNMRDFDKL